MKLDPLRSLAGLSVVLVASAGAAGADVLIVDPSGGSGTYWGNIQVAVNAAADGDTILVRDGNYQRFGVMDKALTIVAEGVDAHVDGFNNLGPGTSSVTVRDLSAGKQVLIRGLRMNYGVTVTDSDGAVWIDDVTCTGGAGICAGGQAPGATVYNSSQVTFTRCSFVGEIAYFPLGTATSSPGMRAVDSVVQLFDTQLTGGAGESAGTSSTPQPGAAGLHVDGSTVTIAGCTITGGGGGVDPSNLCAGATAVGGPGILFSGVPGTIRSVESTAAGGATSLEPLCPGQSGPAGPAIEGTGTIVPLVGFARHLQASSPVRGGETLTFDVEGQPGETPILLVSPTHLPLPLLNYSGVLLVGIPQEDLLMMGPLPASGQGSLSFPAPNVGPAAAAVTYYVQAIFLDPAPRVWVGPGTSVVLLDAGI